MRFSDPLYGYFVNVTDEVHMRVWEPQVPGGAYTGVLIHNEEKHCFAATTLELLIGDARKKLRMLADCS